MIFGLILYNKNQKTPSHIRDEVIRGSTLSKALLLSLNTRNVCYSFLDAVFATSRDKVAIDLFMKDAIAAVKAFALTKIRLLGAENQA